MSNSLRKQFEEQRAKIGPKLQMFANGSTTVNVVRAEHSANMAVTDQQVLQAVPRQRGQSACPLRKRELPSPATKRKKLRELSPDVLVNVFVQLAEDAAGIGTFPYQTGVMRDMLTATVPLSELPQVARDARVTYVELGEPLRAPTPIVSATPPGAPARDLRRVGSARHHRGGRDVLIGIIDVQGFDFSHPDFLDGGETRFFRIWDQGGANRPSPREAGGRGFEYGSLITREHMNAAIAAAPGLSVPAFELEPQSQMAVGSHGTHVASIAAGKRGVCPNALIAGVLVELSQEDLDRRSSFYDSTRLAHAVEWLLDVGMELNAAVSINISLGTNGHAHDGSSGVDRWIDSALSVPGRCVSAAAGNAGQEVAEFEGDIGYIMGRVHTSGRIAASGLEQDIELVVVGNSMVDVSENELEIWYPAQDRFSVAVRPPGSTEWIGPIKPCQFVENRQLPDGSFVSVYNDLYHPANGHNYIAVYLSPLLSPQGVVGVPAGTWTVRLRGEDVRDGSFHGWIERDDPRRIGRLGPREAWTFPSFLSERSYVDNSTVSSLACGQRVISVANLDADNERISITSSQGPTRDGRSKPDLAAAGTDIVAARGFDPDEPWVRMSGTSMASPFVAGVAGLMLAVEPSLTAAQILGIMRRTATPLPDDDYSWKDDAGFGMLNPEACIDEAHKINERTDRT